MLTPSSNPTAIPLSPALSRRGAGHGGWGTQKETPNTWAIRLLGACLVLVLCGTSAWCGSPAIEIELESGIVGIFTTDTLIAALLEDGRVVLLGTDGTTLRELDLNLSVARDWCTIEPGLNALIVTRVHESSSWNLLDKLFKPASRLELWDIETGQLLLQTEYEGDVLECAVNPDLHVLALRLAQVHGEKLTMIDLSSGETVLDKPIPFASVTMAFHGDSLYFVHERGLEVFSPGSGRKWRRAGTHLLNIVIYPELTFRYQENEARRIVSFNTSVDSLIGPLRLIKNSLMAKGLDNLTPDSFRADDDDIWAWISLYRHSNSKVFVNHFKESLYVADFINNTIKSYDINRFGGADTAVGIVIPLETGRCLVGSGAEGEYGRWLRIFDLDEASADIILLDNH